MDQTIYPSDEPPSRRSAFTVIEFVIVLVLIASAIPLLMQTKESMDRDRHIEESNEKVKLISEVVERLFFVNKKFAEDNCYGWADATCAPLTLTPVVVDAETLGVNTYDNEVLSSLRSMGCITAGAIPNLQLQCYDGFGKKILFKGNNLHVAGTPYIDPYNGAFPELQVSTTHAIVKSIQIPNHMAIGLSESNAKLSEITNGIKSFVRQRRIAEISNTCKTSGGTSTNPVGGLNASDDAVIPWVWKLVSNNAFSLCSGMGVGGRSCGCRDYGSNDWSGSPSLCQLNTDAELISFLNNLGLGPRYRSDGFGNAIDIVPLSDSSGSPAGCVPASPATINSSASGNSYPIGGTLPKTRLGVLDGSSWVFYFDVYSE